MRRPGLAPLWKPRDWTYPAEALKTLLDGWAGVGVEVEVNLLDPGPLFLTKQVREGDGALGFSPQFGPHVQDLGHLFLSVNDVAPARGTGTPPS